MLLMHIVYKVHAQEVITNRLLVASLLQSPKYSNELSDDEYLFTLGYSSRKVQGIINGHGNVL